MNPPAKPWQRAAARLGLGRAAYQLWHRPLATLARSRREGGPVAQWITARGRRAMRLAAATLPPVAEPPPDAPTVGFLTGRRFWFQTAFCFWSLCRHAGQPLRAAVYDDGTFDAPLQAECRRLFPGAAILPRAEIEVRLDAQLPACRYPTLRRRRAVYPNLRKLTDVHVGAHGWQLVLDSDMLFFRRPDALLAWLAGPAQPVHMADVQDAYGYSSNLLAALAGQSLPARLNVGICGLRSEEIDWDRLERWSVEMEAAEGTSYYQEQALVALMLAGCDAYCVPAADYRLLPDDTECRQPTAVMHHYVDLSKRGYFRHAWRHVWNP
ncbi:MAG: glycosyl transferase [Verrucomicrobia bacterium]|nr:glycosyl transferase [Verrucomicrobiota bacterium]